MEKSEDPMNSSECLSDESTLAEGSQQLSKSSSLNVTQGAKISTNQNVGVEVRTMEYVSIIPSADSRVSRNTGREKSSNIEASAGKAGGTNPLGQDDVPLCSKVNSTIKWTVTRIVEDANRVHLKGSNVSSNNEDKQLRLNGSGLRAAFKIKSQITRDRSPQLVTSSRELERTAFAEGHQTSPNTRDHKAELPKIPSEKILKMDFKQALASRDTIESPKRSLNFGHSTWRKKTTFPKEQPFDSKKTKISRLGKSNDFLVELQSNSIQNNPILPWDSVQHSEIIKKRGLLEQDLKHKLKRPNQDDLLYDAPKYKKKSRGFEYLR